MSSSQLICTHLNASVGDILCESDVDESIRNGRLSGKSETANALLGCLFLELEPRLIAKCAIEAGATVKQADDLYIDTLKNSSPRCPQWESAVEFLTSPEDIKHHKSFGSWKELETLAIEMVNDASRNAKSEFKPVLGGGTRLMLLMEHRISNDIDLFIRDPQWIGYLTPRLNDRFDGVISGYDEGATSLKFRLSKGEIDFIVSMSLLGLPNDTSPDCVFELEPVAEVLAKKLFYRGWALTPRDLFDWKLIETTLSSDVVHAKEIANLVSSRINQIDAALSLMSTSAKAKLVWDGIRAPDLPDFNESIQWAKNRLIEFGEMNQSTEVDQSLHPGHKT